MRRIRDRKKGTAVAELAVCLPVIFAIVFGSIEACNMIALKQAISEATYDGALRALKPDATESSVLANINAMLAARGITPQSVTIQGPNGSSFASITHGDTVTVTVTALSDGNVAGPRLFGLATTLSSQSTAVKE